MTLHEFRQSLTASEPPAGLTLAFTGLWWNAKGDWTRAHESAQQDEGVEGSWVHTYLRQDTAGIQWHRSAMEIASSCVRFRYTEQKSKSAGFGQQSSITRLEWVAKKSIPTVLLR